MAKQTASTLVYPTGFYVKVRRDHPDKHRAGKDGFIHEDLGVNLSLSFGWTRGIQYQGIPPSLPEVWSKKDVLPSTLGI